MNVCSEHGTNSNVCESAGCFPKTLTAEQINAEIGFPGLPYVYRLLDKFNVTRKS